MQASSSDSTVEIHPTGGRLPVASALLALGVGVLATLEMKDGQAALIRGIMVDITNRKLAEAKLRERDALLQKLSEQVPGVIYQYQVFPDGRSCFPYASEGIRTIYEVTPEEVRESAEAVLSTSNSRSGAWNTTVPVPARKRWRNSAPPVP